MTTDMQREALLFVDRRGRLVVDRDKLHASEGYKLQIFALRELAAIRHRDEKEKGDV